MVRNGKSSSWTEALSDGLQGSVLGPILLLIFIHDLEQIARQIEILKKFADNFKMGQTGELHRKERTCNRQYLDAGVGQEMGHVL